MKWGHGEAVLSCELPALQIASEVESKWKQAFQWCEYGWAQSHCTGILLVFSHPQHVMVYSGGMHFDLENAVPYSNKPAGNFTRMLQTLGVFLIQLAQGRNLLWSLLGIVGQIALESEYDCLFKNMARFTQFGFSLCFLPLSFYLIFSHFSSASHMYVVTCNQQFFSWSQQTAGSNRITLITVMQTSLIFSSS